MQVYAEYALIENFCMDFTLLYAAKAATKNACKTFRLAAAAALGACFAIVYPLFGLEALPPPWGSVSGVALKLAAGALMCALGGRYSRVIGYLKFVAAFSAFTFLVGGALIAIFSLAGVGYEGGGGYLLSSVPVGIPLFVALACVLAVKKLAARARGSLKQSFVCTVYMGCKSAKLYGFYDSGNKVYMGGAPVSILPRHTAEKLVELEGIKTFTDIHTVSGRSRMAVFKADRVEIDDGRVVEVKRGVLFGVSPCRITKIVMHPDLAEVN